MCMYKNLLIKQNKIYLIIRCCRIKFFSENPKKTMTIVQDLFKADDNFCEF